MANQEQEQEVLKNLKENLAAITSTDIEKLIRKNLGDAFNFEPARYMFDRVLKLYKELSESSLDDVGYHLLNSNKEQTHIFLTKIKNIESFDPKSDKSAERHASLIKEICDSYDNIFGAAYPVIAFSKTRKANIDEAEKEIKSKLEELNKSYAEAKIKSENTKNELDAILSKARQAIAEVGIASHAKHFENEAEEQKKQSWWWFWGTILAAIVTIAWGICSPFISFFNGAHTTFEIIQISLGKVIILSILYYILVWCSKNYRANKHNYIVNKHRRNSLQTFEAFAKAADDQDTKNAVLLQATQSIFCPQPSGYAEKDIDGDSPAKLIEIVRSIGASTPRTP